jgi:hypothetical protein
MKWVVITESLAIVFLGSLVWRLASAIDTFAVIINGYRVLSQTSSTAADRVSYTTPLHKTESLGPIE